MTKMKKVALAAAVAALAVPAVAKDGGFEEQRTKKLRVTYRSFKKELERTGQFAAMGISSRCFFAANTVNSIGGEYCEYPSIWLDLGKYDFSVFDRQVQDLLSVSPGAKLMCMIDLNTPYWGTRRFKVDSFSDITHAACSKPWFDQTRRWMLDFIDYAEKKWGAHIDSYILSGGCTSEWYEVDRGQRTDAKDAAWREWCKERGLDYGEGTPGPWELSKAKFENLIYDPQTEGAKIEYWRFHNHLPAEMLLKFAAEARKAIPKGKEIGAFFGYYLVSSKNHCSFAHMDYERVFASDDIDYFIAPGNYSARGIGEGSGSQLVDGTALRHGKRFLHEIDFGPHDQKRWYKGVWKTLEDDIAGNTREAAFAMAKNASYWWFDMWGEFYRNPKVRERIALLKKAQDKLPDAPSVAQTLLVVDPQSSYYFNEKDEKERAFGQHLRNNISKTGAPYDTCSFADLDVIDLAKYKLICLNNTILITPEREKMLKEKVFTPGRTVLWTYAPGLITGKELDAGRVKKFAGVEYGAKGVSETAMEGGWRAVYAHDYKLYDTKTLAGIQERAGVHRYVSVTTPVFAKENFVAVHTAEGGEFEVRLPKTAERVTDLLTGETVAENASSFKAKFASPDTRLFKIGE